MIKIDLYARGSMPLHVTVAWQMQGDYSWLLIICGMNDMSRIIIGKWITIIHGVRSFVKFDINELLSYYQSFVLTL